MKKGKLIVLESGTDSSGKETQTNLLFSRLKNDNLNILKIEYPDYKSESSALIKMYLNGEFGTDPYSVNPFASSSFFAVDRYASFKKKWENIYKNGGIIIADRYTTSNMVHQASKIKDDKEKNYFLEWLYDFEFNKIGIPEPDKVFFLDVPPDVSYSLMKNRKNKINGSSKKDIHENNLDYLLNTYNNALYVSSKYDWERIICVKNGKMKSIQEINDEIYYKAKELINS
ncbi:MAG: dTMP kinase [Thermotogota bacterium]